MAKFGQLSAAGQGALDRALRNLSVGLYHINDANLDDGGISLSKLAVDVATQDEFEVHTSNTGNPHSVTAAQVGNTTAQWNANKLQGASIALAGLASGHMLAYAGTDWINCLGAGSAVWNANKIQGEAVSVTGAATNHVLLRGASSWASTLLFTATTWVPTLTCSGTMTYTDTSVAMANYINVPSMKLCIAWISCSGTIGGTPSITIYATLPVNSGANGEACFCMTYINEGGTTAVGHAYIPASQDKLYVTKQNFANWTAGATREFNVTAVYRTA